MRNSATPETELTLMLAVVEAFNAAEAAGIPMDRNSGGLADYPTYKHEFEMTRYTIQWDSIVERWTLVAETDDAIHVDSLGNRL